MSTPFSDFFSIFFRFFSGKDSGGASAVIQAFPGRARAFSVKKSQRARRPEIFFSIFSGCRIRMKTIMHKQSNK
jgi:hypothetical protein